MAYVRIDSSNPSIIVVRTRVISRRHVTEYTLAKTWEYPSDIP